jgi:hypothetical protein
MSWQAKAWAERKAQDYELDHTTSWVFSTLGNYADKQGENIFPSLSTLEAATRVSERTIRRAIKKLIAVGLLDYGDQSVVADNPRYRNDQLPKVYRFVFARDAAGAPDYSQVGKMPAKKRKPWSRKPKAPTVPAQPDPAPAPELTPPAPVDKSPEPAPPAAPRPDTPSRTPGQTPRHNVHQTYNPLNDPLPPAAPAGTVPESPEVIDYAAVLELRQAARDRLARRGVHITAPLCVPAGGPTP